MASQKHFSIFLTTTKTVRRGPKTSDEMMIGYVETYRALGDAWESTDKDQPDTQVRSGGLVLAAVFQRMDSNGDGKVSRDEIPESQRQRLMRLDTNNDGSISLEEAERLRNFRNRNQ